MPLRPPVCYRAVHQRVTTTPEALWITDEILSNTFKIFCANTKPTRRYGSHVPGPMESRRRTGKRRMAYVTDIGHASTPPLMDLAALWGAFDIRDPTQWRWEPPAASLPAAKPKVELPAWLEDYKLGPREKFAEQAVDPDSTLAQIHHPPKDTALSKELAELREHLRYDSFNQKIEQKLLLGLVSEDELASCLRRVTKYLRRKKYSSSRKNTFKFCLRFYQAVWAGITACKVMSPRDFEGTAFNRLLYLLSQVKHNPDVELLVAEILQAVSEEQLLQMNDGILSVVKSWALSWMNGNHSDIPEKDPAVVEASALALANTLNCLPRERALDIVKQLTICFSEECEQYGVKELGSFPYSWLNMAARVKGVDETLLIEIWQSTDKLMGQTLETGTAHNLSNIGNLSLSRCCDVVLSHWISCDLVNDPASVLETLATLMVNRPPSHKLSCLIAALDLKREMAWAKSKSLFRILRGLGFYSAIYDTLKHLPTLDVKYPAFIISSEIKAIQLKDPHVALKIYKLFPKISIDRKCLATKLDGQHPEFFLHMIRHRIKPEEIWCLLRISPYYLICPNFKRPRYRRGFKALHPHRISLIRRMAIEFAGAKHLTPRQARRNVGQCLLYLKKHRVSIRGKPDLTRALVHAGVTRELMKGKWVGTETLRWVFRWVEIAEGRVVSERLERVLLAWRAEAIEQRRWERRDANPLRVGPID